MDPIYVCRHFYAATGIPVTLVDGDYAVYSSYHDIISATPHYTREWFPLTHNPCFCGDIPDTLFGRVRIEASGLDLYLDPVFSVPLDDERLFQVKKYLMLPPDQPALLNDFLRGIPCQTQVQFAHHLLLLHAAANGRQASLEDLFLEQDAQIQDRQERQLRRRVADLEEENYHNSYYFELELYQRVKDGDVEKLKAFLAVPRQTLHEGRMAAAPLRHAKNMFISFVTKVAMMGAIPGGLDVEKAYQLIDYYAQECEQMDRIEHIDRLQYSMLLDFCQRCAETRIPEGVSPDVYRCMMYIRNHTNEPVSIESAAAFVHRSPSYLMKHFKSELGVHMGAYITRCKLEEAQNLLAYSDKTLAEISSYLCFSSQSYFQNVFKKQYGVTPLAYRKQARSGG